MVVVLYFRDMRNEAQKSLHIRQLPVKTFFNSGLSDVEACTLKKADCFLIGIYRDSVTEKFCLGRSKELPITTESLAHCKTCLAVTWLKVAASPKPRVFSKRENSGMYPGEGWEKFSDLISFWVSKQSVRFGGERRRKTNLPSFLISASLRTC